MLACPFACILQFFLSTSISLYGLHKFIYHGNNKSLKKQRKGEKTGKIDPFFVKICVSFFPQSVFQDNMHHIISEREKNSMHQ
jgi:hypothetical protein